MERKKHGWLIFGVVTLAIVVAFFVTSVVLADIHDVSLVTEWQTWFGIVKPKDVLPEGGVLNAVVIQISNAIKKIVLKFGF